ncbi:MAG: beta-N-acetylhexosaminidase [Clostridiales bacterium]|nr:beta-N-acetylhexosaminidase [Clostridiales bacterium]
MTRKLLLIIFIPICILIIFSACTSKTRPAPQGSPSKDHAGLPITPHQKSKAEIMLSSMTTEQKAGQLLMVPFSGTSITHETEKHFSDHLLSNVILFSANIPDSKTAKQLTMEIQSLSEKLTGMKALISIDQEGGRVVRIRDQVTVFPSARKIGMTGDPKNAYTAGYVTAKQLLRLGINFNLAPVFDVDTNKNNPVIGDRAYSNDPKKVAEFALQFAKGSNDGGMPACAKHFPGHGDTSVDSHKELPILNFDRKRLDSIELYPFKQAVDQKIDAILAGHIACPALDESGLPASLSKKILTDLLRNEYRYNGLILTDSMDMAAITSHFSPEKAAVLAVTAGADMLIAPSDPKTQEIMQKGLLDAIKNGELPLERLNDAVLHILFLKEKYGLLGT